MDTSALFNAYHNWIIAWKNDGRKIWFGTLMLNPLGLNKLSTISPYAARNGADIYYHVNQYCQKPKIKAKRGIANFDRRP